MKSLTVSFFWQTCGRTDNSHITIGTIVTDKKGNLWIASSTGLFKYESNILTKITQTEEEIKHLTFYDKIICLYNINRYLIAGYINIKKSPYLPQRYKRFPPDSQPILWRTTKRLSVGTGAARTFYYDIIKKTLSPIPLKGFPKQPILAIKKDINNTLLIGIDSQGIWNISEKGDKLLNIYKEDLNNPFSLRGDGVYDIFCDKSRNWVATYTGKLSFWKRKLTDYPHCISD